MNFMAGPVLRYKAETYIPVRFLFVLDTEYKDTQESNMNTQRTR
jgi:hypothetical protein